LPGPDSVQIVEVCPRDGLQNETAALATATKIQLIERLVAAGCTRIEASSFVSPAAIPQLADADAVFAAIKDLDGVDLIALVPNERGYDRAIAAGCQSVEVFTAATDAFCRANIRCSVSESFQRFMPIMSRASIDKIPVRGAVSVAFNCPYSGPVEPVLVMLACERLLDIGCHEVSIADTTGRASFDQVARFLERAVARLPLDRIAMHFHDTHALATDHIVTSYNSGIRTFDSSTGGLGGCPFSPEAPGNVDTEDVMLILDDFDIPHGLNAEAIADIATWIRSELTPPGHAAL
jgi:hydroxymethylglutaryl-CoA lyase